MADDLQSLEEWAAPLLERLSDSERQTLWRKVGTELRRSQQARIRRQENPDGSPYSPRKGSKKVRRARKRMKFVYERPGQQPETREIKNWFATPKTYFGWDIDAGALRTFKRSRIIRVLEVDKSPVVAANRLRGQAGGIKRQAMFQKLRTSKYMKLDTSRDGISIGYSGRIAAIAEPHQKGARARVNQYVDYDYPERKLLGYSAEDRALIRDFLIDHLARV